MVVQSPTPHILAPTPSPPSVRVNRNTKAGAAAIPSPAVRTRKTALESLHWIVVGLGVSVAVVCLLDTQRKPSHIRVLSPRYLADLYMEINILRHAQAKLARVEAAIQFSETAPTSPPAAP